jgi:hypothetical protein
MSLFLGKKLYLTFSDWKSISKTHRDFLDVSYEFLIDLDPFYVIFLIIPFKIFKPFHIPPLYFHQKHPEKATLRQTNFGQKSILLVHSEENGISPKLLLSIFSITVGQKYGKKLCKFHRKLPLWAISSKKRTDDFFLLKFFIIRYSTQKHI